MIDLDRYELGESLGKGGFGEVFSARRRDLDRVDAIKVLHEAHCRDAAAVVRFVAEARAASKIDHPGVVRVFDLGTLPDGRAYCVMERLQGRTLRAILDERGALPLAEAQPLLAKIAEAIDAAHAAGVAHRDLKPENLFVEPDGSIRVIDFGLAKLAGESNATTTGHVMGSPRYMSPEQCRGKGADTRSDLYSFGAVAYHVLAGKPPFRGDDALSLALQHLNDKPAPPSEHAPELPPAVDEVILALLAKDPEKRPRPLVLAVTGLTTGVIPHPRRRRMMVAAILAAAAVGGGGAYYALRERPDSRSEVVTEPLRLLASFPIEALESPFLETNTKRLINSHDAEHWVSIEYDRPDRSTTLIRHGHAGFLADGREVVSRPEPKLAVVLIDRTGHETEIAPQARAPALSPDRRFIAFVGPAGIEIFDSSTGKTRTLVSKSQAPSMSWSPSGRELTWIDDGKVQIARRVDGVVRSLELPVMTDSGLSSPAFADDDHLLYCAVENQRITLRRRSTSAAGGLGELVRELDSHVGDCVISAAGNRIAVALTFGRRETARLDLETRRAVPLGLPFGIVANSVAPDGRLVDPVGAEAFDAVTKARTTFKSCAPGPNVVFQGRSGLERWGFFDDHGETLVRFSTNDCKPLGEWKLTGSPNVFQGPRCERGLCVVPTLIDRSISILALDPGKPARTLAKMVVEGTAPIGPVMVAVAPDGNHVAAVAVENLEAPLWIIPATGGAAMALPRVGGIGR